MTASRRHGGTLRKGDTTGGSRKEMERNPRTDGECMIDEPCKAIRFILGAVLDRL